MTHTERRLKRVAYHEAGHVVAAWAYDLRIKHVTIVPRDDSLGHLAHWPWGKDMTAYSLKPGCERRFEAHIVCALAGGLAAKQAGFRDLGSGSDREWAVKCADWTLENGFRPVTGTDVLEAYLRFCEVSAKRLLVNDWVKVEEIVRALLAKHTLAEADIKAVFREVYLREMAEWQATRDGEQA